MSFSRKTDFTLSFITASLKINTSIGKTAKVVLPILF